MTKNPLSEFVIRRRLAETPAARIRRLLSIEVKRFFIPKKADDIAASSPS